MTFFFGVTPSVPSPFGPFTRDNKVDGTLPTQTQLRSSETDLKIVLEFTDSKGVLKQKEYDVYAQIFSSLSKFIDTTLSTEMKEKDTRTIILHDVEPTCFEDAIKFLQDPIATISITPEDVVKVVECYDKYEFIAGIELCDKILYNNIKTEYLDANETNAPANLDLLVTAIALADKCNLPKAAAIGIPYIKRRLGASCSLPYNSTMFTVAHIQQLQGIFQKGCLDSVIPPGMSKEDVGSHLFPKLFVLYRSKEYTCHTIQKILVFWEKTLMEYMN